MVGDKLRFRFEKTGDLRLLSHHDLMRCAERMMRRAAVPFKMTAGFHPAPRLVFALSLSLGIVGRQEVVELELTEPRDADDVLAAFRRHAPAGWTFTSAKVVPMKASAVARRIVYRLPLPPDRVAAVQDLAAAMTASAEVWTDRYHPRPRQVNIRQYLRGVRVDDATRVTEQNVPVSGEDRLCSLPPWGGGLGRGVAASEGEHPSPVQAPLPLTSGFAGPSPQRGEGVLPAHRPEATVSQVAAELATPSPRWGEGPAKPGVRGGPATAGEDRSPAQPHSPLPSPPPQGGREQSRPPTTGGRPGATLTLDLWVTPTGTARADELLALLRVADLLDAGAVLERTELELTDETPPDATDGPPTGPAITRPLNLPAGVVPAEDEPSPTATWGLSPNGPVVE